ncbi:hypothetical protein CTAYLR_002908 [Chrysophaeum taylorii]|uniref:FAS1 domain-containing protein n=1 Tax=Chrysophaeum taylorii TaxID=2483200 RepID=A0AAD7XTL0_9STRA|nr:hypothetical protein CTAYLR_002908 [Chrysophaeum taylorii]
MRLLQALLLVRTAVAYPVDFDCGNACDSTSWVEINDSSKDCAWVAAYPAERCDAVGEGRVLASDACPTACENFFSAANTIRRAEEAPGTIAEIANATENLSTLVLALSLADLVDTLASPGPFTVFAPTNDAFEALPSETFEALLNDTDALGEVLLYHVVDGELFASDLTDGQVVPTFQGSTFNLSVTDDAVVVVYETGNATVVVADIEASNGVIHIIDAVLVPPGDEVVEEPPTDEMVENVTIVDLALMNENLSTLVTALTAADLVATLSGDEPFTVFAPTNDAFDALDEGVLDGLLSDTDALEAILLYHVTTGSVFSTDLFDGQVITMLSGNTTTISISESIMINTANITSADNEASNGVVHIIDAVLFPDDVEEPDVVDCVDSSSWFKNGEPSKDCAWVAEFVPTRCAVKGEDQILADYACPASCDNTCDDSTSWFKNGEPSKDCATRCLSLCVYAWSDVVFPAGAWVSLFPEARCDVFGEERELAEDACPTACAEIVTNVTRRTEEEEMNATILEVAVATESLSTLVDAVIAAGLDETLAGPGPFTVFAPTNDAFDALPNGTLEALLNDTDTLTAILLYHVVSGEVFSANLTDGEMIMTLEGSNFTVAINDTGAFVIFDSGSAAIISADIVASNGVVHVIDMVLIPGIDDDCEDSTSWYKLGDTSKDCAWVAEFVPTRCTVKGEDQILAEYACPVACENTCQDSTSWFKNGEPSKDCAWVSVFPEARCDVFGEERELAADACPTACA